MARLPDPTGSLTGESRKIFDEMLARRQTVGTDLRGPYLILMNDPRLAEHVERLGFYYKFESGVPRDVFEFVVLKLAAAREDKFVWGDHVENARKVGVPEEVISALDSRHDGPPPEPYTAAAELVDLATAYRSIPQELQDRAISAYGVEGLLEIVTLCGFYSMISQVNKCFDVPVPG